MSTPVTLESVLYEVRRIGNRLDLRDDLSDLVRQSLTGIDRIEESIRGLVKRLDLLEIRVGALERKAATWTGPTGGKD